jgi:hypothetical protein
MAKPGKVKSKSNKAVFVKYSATDIVLLIRGQQNLNCHNIEAEQTKPLPNPSQQVKSGSREHKGLPKLGLDVAYRSLLDD